MRKTTNCTRIIRLQHPNTVSFQYCTVWRHMAKVAIFITFYSNFRLLCLQSNDGRLFFVGLWDLIVLLAIRRLLFLLNLLVTL